MRILVAHDDGVNAAQLIPLIRWCRKLGEVTAVVPKFEQSGKSHSFEIKRDVEMKQVELAPDVTVWTVDSTPADCVRFAVLGKGMEFDLCISGVNRGLNLGADIMYSGTAAAASEAVNLGIPAIALSTPPGNYDKATEELDRVFAFIHQHQLLDLHKLYNVNIPASPKGIRITHMGGPYFSDDFVPIGDNLYRPQGKPVWQYSGDDTLDTDATLHGGYISITPLTIDRTDWTVYRQICGLSE